MTSSSSTSFQQLTGLTEANASKLLKKFNNCFPVALASFVQYRAKLSDSAFADPQAHKRNGAEIDAQLTTIYNTVRTVMKDARCSEAAAWTAVQQADGNGPEAIILASGGASAASASAAPPPSAGLLPTPVSAPVLATAPAAAAASSSSPIPSATFKGAFFDMPNFWKEEVEARAPLFNIERGFLAKNRTVLRDRLLKWHAVAGGFYSGTELKYIPITDPDDHLVRVIIKDSVRTFFAEEHRNKFTTFLYSVATEFGSYGQSMSYLAGLCLLGLTEQETVAILRKCNKEYIAGHWATEATGFAVNAYIAEDFIKQRFPDVAQRFQQLQFWPETYMQKIMSGLCVHVLTFDLLFDFLDNFMAEGLPFLIKFVLATVQHFRARLLKVQDSTHVNELYELMRLDERCCDHADGAEILRLAKATNLGLDVEVKNRILTLRTQIYDKVIGPRLAKAPKEEAFEPCELCGKARPVWFCDDECGAICDGCHKGNAKTHLASHKVDKY